MIRRRFKYFMPERNEFSTTGDETLLSVSEYYGVKPRSEAFDADAAEGRAASLEGYRKVKAGDFVMNYMLAWKGAYGVSDHDGIVSPAYAVYKINPKYADQRFIHHRLRSEHMRSVFRARSKGIIESRLRLYPDAFLSMELELPDLETQKAIADFLDRETARIDQLIEKKQRLVALINEKRAVETDRMIFGPVDEGLMPSSKVKFLAKRISKGTTPSTLGAEIVAEGVRFLRAENVWFGIVTDNPQHYISEETHRMMARSALEANDVLVVIAGATTGKAAVIREDQTPANTNQAISYIRLWQPYLAPVVSAAIQTKRVQQEILLTSVQSAQPNLAMEDLGNLEVPAPQREDALALIEKLERADTKFRSLTDSVSDSVGKLQEFRSTLITAAVTGQVDVVSWGKQGQTDRRLDQIQEAMGA